MVSGVSPSHATARFQSLLQTLSDPRTAGKVDDTKVKDLVAAYDAMPGAEKATQALALKAMLQADAFQISDGGRALLAKTLGATPDELRPQGAPGVQRTVAQQAFKLLSGPGKVTEKEFTELLDSLKKMSPGSADLVMGAVQSASADGTIKLEGGARRKNVQEVASRNQDGKLTALNEQFGEKFMKNIPSFILAGMSNPPMFEDLVFILMIGVVKQTQDEVMEEQKRLSQVVEGDAKRNEAAASRKQAFRQLPTGGTSEGAIAPSLDRPLTDIDLAHTEAKIEGGVRSISRALRDDGKINADEARSIVAEFDKFPPQVKTLFAEAVGTALQASGVMRERTGTTPSAKEANANREGITPIFEWAQATTGRDTFDAPTKAPGSKGGPSIAKSLLASDKLEHRVAGFLVDSFFGQGNTAKAGRAPAADPTKPSATETDAVQRFQPVLDEMVSLATAGEGTAAATFGKLVEERQQIADALAAGTLAPKDVLPIEQQIEQAVEAHAADAPPEQKQMLKDALQDALGSLPTDRPATADEVSGALQTATEKIESKASDFVFNAKDASVVELVDGSIENALQRAGGTVANIADTGGAPPTAEETKDILRDALAGERTKFEKELRGNGASPAVTDAMLKSFDAAAGREMEKLGKTGAIETKGPLGQGQESVDPTESDGTRSRQVQFENLKFKMNMLSEIQQSMSAILNTLHQNAETTIRAIR